MRDIIDTRDFGVIEGFDIKAVMLADYDSTPDDADCYSDEDIAAWKRDEWRYVGIEVIASRAGVELGTDSIWGTEYGTLDGRDINPLMDGDADTFANGDGEGLIAIAITHANSTIAAINKTGE